MQVDKAPERALSYFTSTISSGRSISLYQFIKSKVNIYHRFHCAILVSYRKRGSQYKTFCVFRKEEIGIVRLPGFNHFGKPVVFVEILVQKISKHSFLAMLGVNLTDPETIFISKGNELN